MTSKTHATLGMAVAAQIAITHSYSLVYIFISLFASIAPDFDIKLQIKHRTWTHSILALFTSTIILSNVDKTLGLFWFAGYETHLIADSFTKMGVPFFYPFIKDKYGLKIFKTGGTIDILIQCVALIAIFYFSYIYMVNKTGFNFFNL